MLKKYDENTRIFTAALSAFLWAINPVQVQAVTYIVQRMASMAAMFYIIAIFYYLKGRLDFSKKRQALFFAIALLSYLLSFGSKQNGIMLPFALLLIEILFFNFSIKFPSTKTQWFILLLGLFTISLILFTEIFDRIDFDHPEQRAFTAGQRFLTEFRVVIFYISQILYPIASRFSIVHDFHISTSILNPLSTFFSILSIIFLIVFAVMLRKKSPALTFAILFFFLNHIIESTFIPLEIVFEHRNYLPSLFLFFPISIGLYQVLNYYKQKNKFIFFSISGFITCLIILTGFSTYIRNFDWETEESLWLDAMNKAPESARAYQNYAKAFIDRHEANKSANNAIYDYYFNLNRESLDKIVVSAHVRRDFVAYSNMAAARSSQKNFSDALFYIKKAHEVFPGNSKSISSLAKMYLMNGDEKKH
ncbi:tetratricopeptide repeat protein [Desulfamplus magnetovallimortis]|uniref:tetratricopeptide repeat protein n=1 Tax=Desulfamplus magnetovallimortis TaxID=1246637 RepID=UPI00111AA047|nr:hypothetical protein [Desulfamplus magnetovallimortis]